MSSPMPSVDVGNAALAPAASSTTSSPLKAMESQSSVASPSSVTGVWNRNTSSKTILLQLKEEKSKGQEHTVQSNDDPSSNKVDLEAAAEEEAADSSSITKYTHRTPLPVSPSNAYSLPNMITITTLPAPTDVKNKSPIFMKWEQMAAKNNTKNINTTSAVEVVNSPNEEQTPTPITHSNNVDNNAESIAESSPSPVVAYNGKRWSTPKPHAVADEEMQTTLEEVTNKISPTSAIVKIENITSPSAGISKRWPPPKQPPADKEVEVTSPIENSPPLEIVNSPTNQNASTASKLNENSKNSIAAKSSASVSAPGIAYTGRRWSPPKPPAIEQKNGTSTETTNTITPTTIVQLDAINKESNLESSSPSGIRKRWPPSKSPASEEEEEKENITSLETTNQISPPVEVEEKQTPAPITKVEANDTESNVKSSSPPGISRRWPPSKIPANEEEKEVSSLVTTNKDIPTLGTVDEKQTPVPVIKMNANSAESKVKSSTPPGIVKRWPPSNISTNEEKQMPSSTAIKEAIPTVETNSSTVNDTETPTTVYTSKRWTQPNEATTTKPTANKLKRRWPPTPQDDKKEEQAEGETNVEGVLGVGTQSEFRTLVVNLVCKFMPTEVDNVDELIEEYEGREAELLDILTSMQQVNGDCEVGVDDSGNGESICSNKTEPASNTTKEVLSMASTAGHPFDEETAYAVVGNGGEREEEDGDDQRSDKQVRPKCSRRTLIVVAVTSCLFLAGVAIALGSTFGFDIFGEPSESASFTARDDSDMGIATGVFSGATQVPTPSPNENYNSLTLMECDSEEIIQELGLTSLAASYPKIAIDGDQAIVASGSGYVAFFALDSATSTWTRTALFGLMVNVGEITSVAIYGNTAVIGAPKATTDLSAYRDEPLETGAIFIYEKLDPTSSYSWEQKNGPYVPNEYTKSVTMDKFDDANFGTSVDIYDDMIVASAPPESNNRGSVTVFKKESESNEWVQMIRLLPPDSLTCGSKFYGYSVQINEDMIVASSDCDVNVVLYRIDRSAGEIQLMKFQELEYVDAGYGAISSITIGERHLAYSTVRGGLITFQRENQDMKFVLSQELGFEFVSDPDPLYEYPLTSDENLMALSVANNVILYTRNMTSQEWIQESLVLPSQGDFAGYTAASAAISNGILMAADQLEVRAHDFMSCIVKTALESSIVASPASSPTVGENTTSDCFQLDVIVTLDEHPSDTRWEIIPQGESTATAVASSPAYVDSLAFTQADTQTVCLPEGTYDFTIYDDYDGETSSDWFEVSFRLQFDDEEVGSGESFGRNKTVTFSTPTSDECYAVIIDLKFDRYAQDESWNITQDGAVVASSSPFADGVTEDVQELCLPEGDYVFTIYDAYGDGLCCEWGEGSYSVRTDEEDIIAEGAEFGPSESREFTLPVSSR